MNNLSVYRQMVTSPSDLFGVLRKEIGLKSNCSPFAVKAIEALKSLGNLNEAEALKAANTFLDNLQTLTQGGITAEDYDKIDFVKRGGVVTISARVEAFIRAAARKGYRITETIIAVPNDDANSTYFKENFYNGEIIYTLEDKRLNGDRKITAERLMSGYFSKYICRLEVVEIKSNKRLVMEVCEMSNAEMLNVSAASDNGIYKTKWESYKKDNGYGGRRKVITEELNAGSIWCVWTSRMVEKTIIRWALKRVREALPELKDTIYAFDADVPMEQPQEQFFIDIPMEPVTDNVDLSNLTKQQKEEVQEAYDLFSENPKLALDMANEIKHALDNGASMQAVINTYFASILNIEKSKTAYPIIKPYFEPEEPPKTETTALICKVCGKEITSQKSKDFYAEHPTYTPKCYDCNIGGAKK